MGRSQTLRDCGAQHLLQQVATRRRSFLIYTDTYYYSTPSDELYRGHVSIPDPGKVNPQLIKLGIHSARPLRQPLKVVMTILTDIYLDWAQHGICGRGVFLDLVSYYESGGSSLPYDPWTTHAIPLKDILDCAKKQGVEFRLGDILLMRMGFIRRSNSASGEERASFQGKQETLYVTLFSV